MGCNRAFPDAICFFFSDIMFFLVDAMLLVQFVCVSEVMSSQIIQIYKVFTLIFFSLTILLRLLCELWFEKKEVDHNFDDVTANI